MLKKVSNLKLGARRTEAREFLGEAGQHWIDRREDCSAFSGQQHELGDARHDALTRLWSDADQGRVEVGDQIAVDDLGTLHGLARGHVEAGHIPPNVAVADHRDEPGHPDDDDEKLKVTMEFKKSRKLTF